MKFMILKDLYLRLFSGHERSIKAKKNIALSFIVKGFSIVTHLILVRLTIDYVNPTKYGIWLTLSSIIGWLSFFDIGFGHGLRNKFSEAKANGNDFLIKSYVSTTYAVLIVVFSLIWLVLFLINDYLSWSDLLNAPISMNDELSKLSIVLFTFFCFQIVLKTISSIILADQRPALSSLFNAISQGIILVVIYIITTTKHNGSLISLGFIYGAIPVVVLLFGSFYFFLKDYRDYSPSIFNIDLSSSKEIFSLGSKFFLIQFAVIIINQTNNIIIANVSSPSDVTVFNIAYKYMSIALMTFTIIVTPFWSAFTEAYTKKDFEWMMNVLSKLRKISYLLIFCLFLLVFFSESIYSIWIGGTITIPISVSITVALYISLLIMVGLYTQILNGIGYIRFQMITYSFAIIFHIPLAIYLGEKNGLIGVLFSAIFLYLIIVLFARHQVNLLLTRRASGWWLK